MLNKKIEDDLKNALRNREESKVSTLRMLKAAIKNALIEKRKDVLGEADIIAIIKKQIKQRKESIEAFNKGNRTDLADKEKQELDILSVYLPPELPEEEIVKVVIKAIEETQASGKKDTGQVMKSAMSELKGKADGSLVSKIAAEQLAKLEGGSKNGTTEEG